MVTCAPTGHWRPAPPRRERTRPAQALSNKLSFSSMRWRPREHFSEKRRMGLCWRNAPAMPRTVSWGRDRKKAVEQLSRDEAQGDEKG